MMTRSIAGLDVHKRVLMAVVAIGGAPEEMRFERRRFGTTTSELRHLLAWLQQMGAQDVVMESTAQYWKPVWLSLEGAFQLFLAQAWSNRAPRGKKADFKDAEQRTMRNLTRRRTQLTRDRVRIQNQVESLLEETRIKVSSMVSDLFGASGLRMLTALGKGETDPGKLAALADARVQRSQEELADALNGALTDTHRRILKQHLAMLSLVDEQMAELSQLTAQTMHEYGDAITRLAQIPGIRVTAAQQILAETGPRASAFPSAAQFSSWIGVCPGRAESAEQNHSSRCAKGNLYLRRVLCQAAQAAVRTNNSFFQRKFRSLLPRLGYTKAVWAIARHLSVVIWKILHENAAYQERGSATTPQAMKRRIQRLKHDLRAMGYSDILIPLQVQAAEA